MSITVMCACGRFFEAPEASAGGRARCPECGYEAIVSELAADRDPDSLGGRPGPSAVSGKAVASLVLGLFFLLAFFTGLPAIVLGRQALREIRWSGGRLRGRGMAVAGIVLGVFGCLFTLAWLMPATRSAREAARRSQCVNNLKQIGLALDNYHTVHGCLPPAAIVDKNGRPLLSWRVAILPYIESSPLYSKFHLDEPWDSPHNLSLLEPMPYIYVCPSDRTQKPGTTGYQVVIGPATAFRPDFRPVSFPEITDGLDGTLLVGEAHHGVPWTKPEDIPFDRNLPLTGLGSDHGYHNNGFNALFANGAVRFLKHSIARGVLDALLTRSGKEEVSSESY